MSTSITGVDVSSWQHQGNELIDWWRVAQDGISFVVIKATQGTTYANPWLVRDISDANAAGLLVGAYHYFEAGEDPAAQAKWAMSNLVMQQLDLGAFVDWECYTAAPYTHTQELTAFLAEARLTRPQTGVYCSEDWANVLEKESVHLGRLWVASVGAAPEVGYTIWQQGTVRPIDGIPGPVDINVIQNTRGLDIPTAPPAERTAVQLYSLKEAEEAEEAEVGDYPPETDDDD